jgi:hypothetical protein
MRRVLAVALALIGLAVTVVPAGAANVALFFNPSFVDTATDGSGEAYNVQQGLIAQGHTVTTFTGTSAAALSAALVGKSVLVIPELQNGNLSPVLDKNASLTLALFVDNGGTLVMFDPGVGDPLAVLNQSFPQFKLTSDGGAVGTISKTAAAAGTPFASGPATLTTNLNAVDTIKADSLPSSATLPLSSHIIYADGNGNAAVTLIQYGGGNIVIFGWDWFDAAPVGGQDGGWLSVLDIAGNDVVGTQPIPTLSEWAMIAMAGLLLVVGIGALRRPRALAG